MLENDNATPIDVSNKVRLFKGIKGYPVKVPYGPGEDYPEFQKFAWASKALMEN